MTWLRIFGPPLLSVVGITLALWSGSNWACLLVGFGAGMIAAAWIVALKKSGKGWAK